MAVGASTGAMSAYQQTKASNAAADYNASMLERNAEVSEMQARNAQERGARETTAHRRRVKSMIGSQRSSAGASGVLVDAGSTLDVVSDTATYGELDAQTIRRNASMEAWGLTEQAKGQRYQADITRSQKRSKTSAVATSLLTQGSSYAATYYGSKR